MIWFVAVWQAMVWTLVIVQPHPHLDMHHCVFNKAAFTESCWPKDGCFMLTPTDAMCWRAHAKLVGR